MQCACVSVWTHLFHAQKQRNAPRDAREATDGIFLILNSDTGVEYIHVRSQTSALERRARRPTNSVRIVALQDHPFPGQLVHIRGVNFCWCRIIRVAVVTNIRMAKVIS